LLSRLVVDLVGIISLEAICREWAPGLFRIHYGTGSRVKGG